MKDPPGKPPPDVAWIRNGVLESSGKKAASLKFDNINRTDAGQYTCRANNSVEVTSIDTTIVVYCKYILTFIFFISEFTSFTVQLLLMSFKYTKLRNLFESVRKQNFTSILFGFVCVGKSWLGQLDLGGIIAYIILLQRT